MNEGCEDMLSLQQEAFEMKKLMQMQMKTMQAQSKLLVTNLIVNIPHSELATKPYNAREVKALEGCYLLIFTK